MAAEFWKVASTLPRTARFSASCPPLAASHATLSAGAGEVAGILRSQVGVDGHAVLRLRILVAHPHGLRDGVDGSRLAADGTGSGSGVGVGVGSGVGVGVGSCLDVAGGSGTAGCTVLPDAGCFSAALSAESSVCGVDFDDSTPASVSVALPSAGAATAYPPLLPHCRFPELEVILPAQSQVSVFCFALVLHSPPRISRIASMSRRKRFVS